MVKVPLSTATRSPDLGLLTFKVSDITGKVHEVSEKGVLDYVSSLSAIRPSACNWNANMVGTCQLFNLPNVTIPVFNRFGSPHITITFHMIVKTLQQSFKLLGLSGVNLELKSFTNAMHLRFGCLGENNLMLTAAAYGIKLNRSIVRHVCRTCDYCPSKKNFLPAAPLSLTLAPIQASEQVDTLLVDFKEMTNLLPYRRYCLIAALETKGYIWIIPSDTRAATPHLKDIIIKHQLKRVRVFSDRAADFKPFAAWCKLNGISAEVSELGRDEFKGRQEAQVHRATDQTFWWLERLGNIYPSLKKRWDISCYIAAFTLNTRFYSPSSSIPWRNLFSDRPRMDILPITYVSIVVNTKVSLEKTKRAIYLGQTSPLEACVFDGKEITKVHPATIRCPAIDVEEYVDIMTSGEIVLGRLSTSARGLVKGERRSEEFKNAVLQHANKLITKNIFHKISAQDDVPSVATRSFFVGRKVDDELTARLVSNGALTSDEPLSSYLPSIGERFLFLKLLTIARKQGATVFAGDVSAAYYSTRGSGFISLPAEWPPQLGGFDPNETVRITCAIPGDSLSSGLFLTQMAKKLEECGISCVEGRIHSNGVTTVIFYSDDFLGFTFGGEEAIKALRTGLASQFVIDFTIGLTQKWVSLDFSFDEDDLVVSMKSTVDAYEVTDATKFTLVAFERLNLSTKSTDERSKKTAMKWVGRVNYLGNISLKVAYLSSYLASALHYDPVGVTIIAKSIIKDLQLYPPFLRFSATVPKYLVGYSDASHSLATCRAHAGHVFQLQDNPTPEPLINPISWRSYRLTRLYDSVFSAEAKAASVALAEFGVLNKMVSKWFQVENIIFIDNKALVNKLNDDTPVHPYSSDIVDFTREKMREVKVKADWVASANNISDDGTKLKLLKIGA